MTRDILFGKSVAIFKYHMTNYYYTNCVNRKYIKVYQMITRTIYLNMEDESL